MPDDAQTVRAPVKLEPFEGTEVIAASIAITKAGDGLSDALSVEPEAFHLGERLYVVLECEVAKVRYSDVKDTGSLRREHTFEARGATLVDATLVADLVQAQREKIQHAKEQAAGIERLPFEDHADADGVVMTALLKCTKDQLISLADVNGVAMPRSANKQRMAELLAEVPGIEHAAGSYSTVPDSEATVTSIAEAVPDNEE